MNEEEKKHTLLMLKQLNSSNLLDGFISLLFVGENASEKEKEACKEMAKRLYECVDEINWGEKNSSRIKYMLAKAAGVKNNKLDDNNEE